VWGFSPEESIDMMRYRLCMGARPHVNGEVVRLFELTGQDFELVWSIKDLRTWVGEGDIEKEDCLK
jgi:hypothetical protein